MRDMGLVEVRMSAPDETPVVVLKEAEGPRHLAIWMSANGAAAVLSALEPPDPDHPTCHDLVVDVVEILSRRIEAVHIVGHQEGHFYAEIIVAGDAVPARPSDALAVALRAGCPIRCAEGVLAAVGIAYGGADEEAAGPADAVVEKFREFLDSVNPDDF